jgi:phage-related minor tail protein
MDSFKNMFKKIISEIIAQALRLAVIQPLLSAVFGAFGFNIGFTGSGGIESITKRERGGNVMRNKPYLVGERGPELMVPLSSGSIVPNDALGTGGGRSYVTYNINAVDAASFRALVARDPEFIYNVARVGERRLPA